MALAGTFSVALLFQSEVALERLGRGRGGRRAILMCYFCCNGEQGD